MPDIGYRTPEERTESRARIALATARICQGISPDSEPVCPNFFQRPNLVIINFGLWLLIGAVGTFIVAVLA